MQAPLQTNNSYHQLKNITFLLFLLFCFTQSKGQDTVLKISNGYIKGISENQSLVFKGVPYAQPPVGTLRFKSPQPAKNWKDTLSCEKFSSIAPQYDGRKQGLTGSENCLSLNIYTPVTGPKAKMPVVVWVHGGAMTAGAGKGQNGHVFSDRDSIVTVTINYRLGVFGFLYMDDVQQGYKGSANNGMMDCIMALKWIKQNISAFGGDPSRVTIMGESAGAKLISTLLISAQAKGYFQQMILESGGLQCVRDTMTAKTIRQRLLDTLQLSHPADLLSLSTEKLIDAQNKVCGGAKGTNYFGPAADGIILTGDPYQYLIQHPNPAIKMLIGTNSAESKMFMGFDKRLYQPDKKVLEDWFGNNYPFVFAAYQKAAAQLPPATAATTVLTQYMYQMHSYRLASVLAKNGNLIWMYRFDYSKDNTGASHAQEMQYVWSSPSNHLTNQADELLGPQMHQAWVNFIKGKKPGKVNNEDWPLYHTKTNAIFIFDRTSHPQLLKEVFNDPVYPSEGFKL